MKKKIIFCVISLFFLLLFFLIVVKVWIGLFRYSNNDYIVSSEEKGYSETNDAEGPVEVDATKSPVVLECESKEESKPTTISLGEFRVTAYCACEKCCGKWANDRPVDENGEYIVIGASGERLYQGVSVAVDPNVIPYGTKIYIDGVEYIAHDCGGSIKGNRIDVYFIEHQDALDFGVKTSIVELNLKSE